MTGSWSELPQAGPLLLVDQSREALVTALQDLPGAIYRELQAVACHPTRSNIEAARRSLYGAQRLLGLLSEVSP